MIACLAVTAWGAVDSPRFQTVKDPAAQRAACVVPVRGHSPRWDRGALERASRICKTRPVSRA